MTPPQAPELHPNILSFINVNEQTFNHTSLLGMLSPWMGKATDIDFVKSDRYDVKLDRHGLVSHGGEMRMKI
jgi:hypothetical protein